MEIGCATSTKPSYRETETINKMVSLSVYLERPFAKQRTARRSVNSSSQDFQHPRRAYAYKEESDEEVRARAVDDDARKKIQEDARVVRDSTRWSRKRKRERGYIGATSSRGSE